MTILGVPLVAESNFVTTPLAPFTSPLEMSMFLANITYIHQELRW